MLASSWKPYPKVYGLGQRAIADLFLDPVVVEEKVDGSQFSFGIFDGELRAKSKNKDLVLDAPDKMFSKAVETVLELGPILRNGWTYRGEYLQSPKHNGLAYDRVPAKHIILFDVNCGEEKYLSRADKEAEAARIGLEIVPVICEGRVTSAEEMDAHMDRVSILGGAKIEGLVVKNYTYFFDGQCLMGKHVREDFREIQSGAWRDNNPTKGDVVEELGEKLRTPARWEKAAQHLREQGRLTDSQKDIGPLLKEVQKDIAEECEELIKSTLYAWARPHILRKSIAGLPDWWKSKLLEKQFAGAPSEVSK